jgi:hypothetical protein
MGVDIGVKLACKPVIGALDFFGAGATCNAKILVVVVQRVSLRQLIVEFLKVICMEVICMGVIGMESGSENL